MSILIRFSLLFFALGGGGGRGGIGWRGRSDSLKGVMEVLELVG